MGQSNPYFKPNVKLKDPNLAAMPLGAPVAKAKPQQGPPGSSTFKGESGIDPYAPIRQMQGAQDEMNAAHMDMVKASATQPTLKHSVIGGLVGAGMGAAAGGPAGAQIGREIVEQPKKQAMGLAAQRAEAAKGKMGSSESFAKAVQAAQGLFNDERTEDRQAATAATNADQAERAMNPPENINGRMVQTPKLAAPAGQPAQPNVDQGPVAPPKADVEIIIHPQTGKVWAIDKNATDPSQMAQEVPGIELPPTPENLSAFNTIYKTWLDATPAATPEAKQAKALSIATQLAAAGATSISLDDRRNDREDTTSVAVADITSRVQNLPEVKAAFTSADPNAYTNAIEAALSKISQGSSNYAVYINEARAELLKSRPSRPPGQKGASSIDLLRQQRTAPAPGAAPPAPVK